LDKAVSENSAETILRVNNIEVIYDHVILVLKGVSLEVPEGGIVALLGANGAGKTTTLKSVSNLIRAERGEVTKGFIEYRGARIGDLTPNQLVSRGVIQVMEGRHCFEHLTVEENLMTGAYTRRDGASGVKDSLEKVYTYFPALRERRGSQGGYISGGEQQMTAIGRALMSNPSMMLLDEPSMGLAPQLEHEREGEPFDPARRAEHQYGAALRPLRLHPGKRPCRSRRRSKRVAREPGRQGILSRHQHRRAQELSRHKALQAPQTLARLTARALGPGR
jgi:ABC-type branched-subunit amino acid transport system ATPase component